MFRKQLMAWYDPIATTKHKLLIQNLAATEFGLTGTISSMLDFFETSIWIGRQFHFSLDGWVHGDWLQFFDDSLGSSSKTGVVIPLDLDIDIPMEKVGTDLKWFLFEGIAYEEDHNSPIVVFENPSWPPKSVVTYPQHHNAVYNFEWYEEELKKYHFDRRIML
jgi:hypothetical protein